MKTTGCLSLSLISLTSFKLGGQCVAVWTVAGCCIWTTAGNVNVHSLWPSDLLINIITVTVSCSYALALGEKRLYSCNSMKKYTVYASQSSKLFPGKLQHFYNLCIGPSYCIFCLAVFIKLFPAPPPKKKRGKLFSFGVSVLVACLPWILQRNCPVFIIQLSSLYCNLNNGITSNILPENSSLFYVIKLNNLTSTRSWDSPFKRT